MAVLQQRLGGDRRDVLQCGAVEESGIPWTHLEAGEFMPNTTIWADQIRTTGQVREAYPEAANAPMTS